MTTTTISTSQFYNDDGFLFAAANDTLNVMKLGGLIGGGTGVLANYANDTILNRGYLSGLYAVQFGSTASGGTLENYDSGIVTGYLSGVFLQGTGTLVDNSGQINGLNAVEITGGSGDSVNNGGRISGEYGITVGGSSNDVIYNDGVISGQRDSISVINNGSTTSDNLVINNDVGGLLDGSVAINAATATIHNSGTIDGNLTFGTGTNTLDGVGGTVNGSITGGTGNDTFDLSKQAVTGTIAGGGGEDLVTFAGAAAGVTVDLSHGTASTGGESFSLSAISDVTGSASADTITGDGNANVIMAGAGADTVSGGPGNDTIYGNGGADILNGNGGADRLIGGGGADTLTGGAGNDIFVYSLVTDSTPAAPDLITDFVHGSDKIDLTALHTNASDKFSIASSNGITTVSVDLGGNGTVDELIKLTGSNVLTASDVLWTTSTPATTHAAEPHALATIMHSQLATSVHAATADHGLYG